MVSGVRIWLLLATSFLSTGEVCPKEAVFLFRVLVHGVGCSIGVAQICLCVGEASFCGRLQLNHLDQQQAQRTKVKGELRSSVTRRSSPIETGTTERMLEADAHIKW